MAILDIKMPQEFIDKLEKMENYEELATKILTSSQVILARNLKERLKKNKNTGTLQTSIKPTKVLKNKYGFYVTIRPTGSDSKGVRNMDKLAYLEFGTKKQSPNFPITLAKKDSELEVAEAMQKTYEREVGW